MPPRKIAGLVICFIGFVLVELHGETKVRILRLVLTKQPPRLRLGENMNYHLFLSHVWSTAQDQVAVIKRMLQLLLPGVRVFLDVDDLDEIGNLEQHVQASQCVLLFLSRGYFESINCRREIVCTFDGNKKPLAIVHEPDAAHGGAPIDALQLEFNAQPWSSAAAASHMATHIFEPSQIIEWLRIKVFQTVSVRLISEQLVRASPKYVRMEKVRLYLPEQEDQKLALPSDTCVYYSAANPGAHELAMEFVEFITSTIHERRQTEAIRKKSRRRIHTKLQKRKGDVQAQGLTAGQSSAETSEADVVSSSDPHSRHSRCNSLAAVEKSGEAFATCFTDDPNDIGMEGTDGVASEWADQQEASPGGAGILPRSPSLGQLSLRTSKRAQDASAPKAKYMLLLLNHSTFTGEQGKVLAAQVRTALKKKVNMVMVHETDATSRDGCEFSRFFTTTPTDLINAGLYHALAIAAVREPYRDVSNTQIATAIGAVKQTSLGAAQEMVKKMSRAGTQDLTSAAAAAVSAYAGHAARAGRECGGQLLRRTSTAGRSDRYSDAKAEPSAADDAAIVSHFDEVELSATADAAIYATELPACDGQLHTQASAEAAAMPDVEAARE